MFEGASARDNSDGVHRGSHTPLGGARPCANNQPTSARPIRQTGSPINRHGTGRTELTGRGSVLKRGAEIAARSRPAPDAHAGTQRLCTQRAEVGAGATFAFCCACLRARPAENTHL